MPWLETLKNPYKKFLHIVQKLEHIIVIIYQISLEIQVRQVW